MIIDMINGFVFAGLSSFLNFLPSVDLTQIPMAQFLVWFIDLLNLVSYLLPVKGLLTIFFLWLAIKNFHFIWRLIQRVWDALPLT